MPQLVGLEQCRARLCQRPGRQRFACEAKGETPAFPVTTNAGSVVVVDGAHTTAFAPSRRGEPADGELGSHPDRPHHAGHVSREHGQRRPQIIAADVTFTDPDNNFDGGTLTVTGLLAQDTVAIRNQGTGAGQIGVSGSDVSFGGSVIGSFAGGAGSTLDRHLQRGGDGGGDRGADREPDLRQFLGRADREPQPRAQGHRRRRLRRHRAARVRGADRRRQSVQRRRCGVREHAQLRRPRRRRRPRRGRRGR